MENNIFIYLKKERKQILEFLLFVEKYVLKTEHINCWKDDKKCLSCEDVYKITEDILPILDMIGANWCDFCGKNLLIEFLHFDNDGNYWCKDFLNCTNENPERTP